MQDGSPGSLRIGAYTGAVAPAFRDAALLDAMARLPDLLRAAGSELIAEGRNRHVRVRLPCGATELDCLVKCFGRQPAWRDLMARGRGSKARRSWQAAAFLAAHDVGTPRPIGYLERWEGPRLLASYFIAEFQSDAVSFKQELIRLFREEPHCWRFMALLQTVAEAIGAMHAAGFQHNDLGNQNILLRRTGPGQWTSVQFIDLNRARRRPALSSRQRARDLSRIYLPSDLLRVFLEMYFGGRTPPPGAFLRWERFFRHRYALHAATRRLRHPLRPRPPAADGGNYPAPREMWIWDERSGQPISVWRSRDRRRLHTVGALVQPALAAARGALAVRREYRRLLAGAYGAPVELKGRIGVAVEPSPESWPRERELLRELGPVPVLIRLYHHQTEAERTFAIATARELSAAGQPLAVALVQDRRAVREPASWDHFVAQALAAVGDAAEWVEVGHAINRVKWGVWNFAEHRRLLEPVAAAARQSRARFMGPAAIDFEYPFLMAALRNLPPGLRFAALSHHLYVDRRGAPENRQGRFAALEKFALARAIARQAPACDDRLIVSEVNWPLQGTGVYSPVGSPYESPGERRNDPSVTEAQYAAYMIRYLAIALCSGLVDRVYWWRLAARGYGLVDDTGPAAGRRRPAFDALKHFLATAGKARFVRREKPPPGPATAGGGQPVFLRFAAPGAGEFCLAYAHGGDAEVPLPFECRAATALDGRTAPALQGGRVRLTEQPLYLAVS